MSFHEVYTNQVALLLEVLPVLNDFKCFALKGGTAINLFIHDMPRLSVDIDLTYLPIESRDIFLQNIEIELLKMKQAIEQLGVTVKTVPMKNGSISKLQVYSNNGMIKIDPNFVLRGFVFPCNGIDSLPGIQWKLCNINKIPAEKKKEQLNKLKQVLEV